MHGFFVQTWIDNTTPYNGLYTNTLPVPLVEAYQAYCNRQARPRLTYVVGKRLHPAFQGEHYVRWEHADVCPGEYAGCLFVLDDVVPFLRAGLQKHLPPCVKLIVLGPFESEPDLLAILNFLRWNDRKPPVQTLDDLRGYVHYTPPTHVFPRTFAPTRAFHYPSTPYGPASAPRLDAIDVYAVRLHEAQAAVYEEAPALRPLLLAGPSDDLKRHGMKLYTLRKHAAGKVLVVTRFPDLVTLNVHVASHEDAGAYQADQVHILDPPDRWSVVERILQGSPGAKVFLYASLLPDETKESLDMYMYRRLEPEAHQHADLTAMLVRNSVTRAPSLADLEQVLSLRLPRREILFEMMMTANYDCDHLEAMLADLIRDKTPLTVAGARGFLNSNYKFQKAP